MVHLRLFALAAIVTVGVCFTPNLKKENEDINSEEFVGKTAWVKDLPPVQYGAFASAMCVDSASGALIEAVYDNPGVVRIDPDVTGSVLSTELAELPYPSSVVCDGAGVAYIASSVSPSAVAAVELSFQKQLIVKTEPTFLPDGCGGVLVMKYSKKLDILVASCGSAPATVVRIDIDKSNSELYTLAASDRKLVRGAGARGPWGLALYDTPSASFAIVGMADGMIAKLALPSLDVVGQLQTPGPTPATPTPPLLPPLPRHAPLLSPMRWRALEMRGAVCAAEGWRRCGVRGAGKRLGYFSVGHNMKTLLMFSPFPWRRIMILKGLDKDFAEGSIVSTGLDQDLEFVTELFLSPDSATAYIIGNSQRKLPAVLQLDTDDPFNTWGIILAGVCNKEQSEVEVEYSWCEWGPKGRTARAAAFDMAGGGRAHRLYIGVSAKYCAHCDEWNKDNNKRCKDGKEAEDYYDDKTYCLHEEWNQRQAVWGGDVGVGFIDEKSNKAWGGDNSSVVVMQLGAIPKIGGVSPASALAPWLHSALLVSLAATAALLQARAL